jgi:hypothetical protein
MTANSSFDTWTVTPIQLKFHDGSALNATVVVSNFAALKASLLTGQALAGGVGDGLKPDDRGLQAPGAESWFSGPRSLATQVGYVVAQAMIGSGCRQGRRPRNVGAGIPVYQDWQPNSHLHGVARVGRIDGLNLRPPKTGGVDMLGPPTNTIKRFEGQSGYRVDSRTGVGERGLRHAPARPSPTPPTTSASARPTAQGGPNHRAEKIFGGGYAGSVNGLASIIPDSPYYRRPATRRC